MRRDRSQAALVRSYSEAQAIPLRTAQHHARVGNPKFLAWVSTYAPAGATASTESPVDPAQADPLARAAAAVETTWQVAEKTKLRLDAAPAAFIDSAAKGYATALKAHRDALAHLQRVKVELGHLVPAGELAKIRRDFVDPLGELFRVFDIELGPEANPLDPRRGIAACAEWRKSKLYPVLAALSQATSTAPSAEPSAPA